MFQRDVTARWIRREPAHVVRSNTRRAFDYFYSQKDFIEHDYLRDTRLLFYEEVADRTMAAYAERHRDGPPRRILDVGCGTGHFLRALMRLAGPECEFVGIDFSTSALETARGLLPMATFLCADAYDLPFGDDEFDLVVCMETLEHLKTPAKALTEIIRVLAVDGLAVITVPDGAKDDWKGHRHRWTAEQLTGFIRLHASSVAVRRVPPDDDLMAVVAKFACLEH